MRLEKNGGKNPNGRDLIELFAIIVFALTTIPVVFFTDGSIKIIFGLVFVLLCPGYTLIALLYPHPKVLNGVALLVLSLGLSVAMVSLIGLVLNYSTIGLTAQSVYFSMLGFILVTAGLALLRRKLLRKNDLRGSLNIPNLRLSASAWIGHSWSDILLAIVLAIVSVGALGMLYVNVNMAKSSPGFTEFYFLGPDGSANYYPREAVLGQDTSYVLGIINHEDAPTVYRLEVTIEGERVAAIGPVSVDPNQKWEGKVSFRSSQVGVNQKVQFWLFRTNIDAPYREIHLWLDVKEK